ncbi:MAG: beta-propeller fold lactonase family protein [Ferruginibacter sp.]
MKKNYLLKAALGVAIWLTVASCNKKNDMGMESIDARTSLEEMMSEKGANPDEAAINENSANVTVLERPGSNNVHFLYTESNCEGINQIMRYKVKNNGILHYAGSTASGGNGTGKGLGSQGALMLDKGHNWLFAVNAGDNTVSSFKVHNDGSLSLAHTENSKGMSPVSVSVHGNLLYVLNRGSDNIHGFRIGQDGSLTHIEGSMQALSGMAVDAPQISFTPNGDWIVVTEKATNTIGTFRVKNNGTVSPGIFTPSVGQTPFGFDFARGRFMIVTNAVGGAPGASSVTSYTNLGNGIPKDVNGAIPNGQGAACWMAVSAYGRFAYATNTASNNISSYYVAPWGALYLIQAVAGKSGLGPLDIVVAANNYHVYALTTKSNSISAFSRKLLGGLQSITGVEGIPSSATGLAIY